MQSSADQAGRQPPVDASGDKSVVGSLFPLDVMSEVVLSCDLQRAAHAMSGTHDASRNPEICVAIP